MRPLTRTLSSLVGLAALASIAACESGAGERPLEPDSDSPVIPSDAASIPRDAGLEGRLDAAPEHPRDASGGADAAPPRRDAGPDAALETDASVGSPMDAGLDAGPASSDAAAGMPDAARPSGAKFRNPLNQQQGSDPWMFHHEGYYYLTATTWASNLTIRKSATIAGLKTAASTTIWTGDNAARCCNMWAPEIHLLEGPNGKRWYLYYTAGPQGSDTGNQRNHVLESAGTDPMGPYTYKARVFDSRNDSWAIDASVVTIHGALYFLFSAWEGDNQNLFIAPMRDPWTLSGSRVRISQPDKAWETSLANVNEGPEPLQHDGRTFITYSASACWGPDYKLGMLTLSGTDPLAARAWVKSAQPVFARSDANRAFGPGHNGFFKSPDGTEDWIVYHANDSASGACDTKRTTRAQKFSWNADGTPNFGAPVASNVDIAVPAGE